MAIGKSENVNKHILRLFKHTISRLPEEDIGPSREQVEGCPIVCASNEPRTRHRIEHQDEQGSESS